MTVCIAGTCDKSEHAVVLASDRMVTESSTLSVEFEPNQPKMTELTKNSIALTSGSALVPSDMEAKLRERDLSENISDVAETVKNTINELAQQKLIDNHLATYDLDIDSFFNEVPDETVKMQLFQDMENDRRSNPLGIRLLIGGIDDHGAHIFLVGDPSYKSCFDGIGFHAIGSGTDHARGSLIFNGFKQEEKTIKEGAYLVYEAKKAAEIAPGVGKEYTDMWVITDEGINKLDESIIEEFESIRKQKIQQNKDSLQQAFDNLEEKELPLTFPVS